MKSILIYYVAVAAVVTTGFAADPCFDNVDPETGNFAICVPATSCTNESFIDDACPSYPSSYACCFDENFPGRELRAAWIATVTNIDWPKSPTSSVTVQQEELRFLVDQLVIAKINTIYFQVRPAGDALYSSDIEPWSRFLTGEQGSPPQPLWDPLSFVISYCHQFNIEVHAWINPYRANLQATTNGLAQNHMAILYPEYAYSYSTYVWMDPGASVVQNRTYDVVIDLVTRYDLDGIHMDDYFYPYPEGGQLFPDNKTYDAYLQTGGTMDLGDWRRDNVNKLVRRLNIGVHEVKPWIKYSISPFGLFRPGHPEGMPAPITGFDQYSEIYCDAKLWLQQGWIDVLQPQLYWRIDPPQQSYPVLLDWWVEQNVMGRHVYAGNYLTRIELQDWPLEEIKNQVMISRESKNRIRGSWGTVMFSAKMFRDDFKGVVGFFNTSVYPYPALQPEFSWLADNDTKKLKETIPRIQVIGKYLKLAEEIDQLSWHKLAIYKLSELLGWQLYKVIVLGPLQIETNNELRKIELISGKYAISGIDRVGQESRKAHFRIME